MASTIAGDADGGRSPGRGLRVGRREVLAGAGGLFLPSLFRGRSALGAVAPKRLVIFYCSQHGPVYQNWSMRRPGLPDVERDWEFPLDDPNESSFSEILRPLHPHRRKLIVPDGISYVASFALKGGGFNTHNVGNAVALTGGGVKQGGFRNEGTATHPSIDQVLAAEVAVPGAVRSLVVGHGGLLDNASFGQGGSIIQPETNPASTFGRIFSNLPSGMSDPAAVSEALGRRKNVLGTVRAQYEQLLPRLGRQDADKVKLHLDLLRDLEAQTAAPRMPVKCGEVDRPSGDSIDAYMKMVAAAMACDRTRVAVIQHKELPASAFGGGNTSVHEGIAHHARPGNQTSLRLMTQYYLVHARQFAKLVSYFDAIPEGNGTLLDNSLLLWVSQLASGVHDHNRVMMIMAGSLGGAFRTGRYIKYAETDPVPEGFIYNKLVQFNGWGKGKNALGPAHNKLYIAIMQAMGSTKNSIGLTSAAADGGTLDMTGPLPRLRGA